MPISFLLAPRKKSSSLFYILEKCYFYKLYWYRATRLTWPFFFFHLLDHLFRCDPGPYSKSICCQLPLLGAPASATAGGHVRWREEVARNRRGILHHPAAYIVTRVLVATSASDSSQRSETEKHFLTCCCFFFYISLNCLWWYLCR